MVADVKTSELFPTISRSKIPSRGISFFSAQITCKKFQPPRVRKSNNRVSSVGGRTVLPSKTYTVGSFLNIEKGAK